ncbi:MAG: HAMP domain-containing protein [Firmicutes bacterium]|nr:HAMP domain-containing protein [Bacillota bacterium]
MVSILLSIGLIGTFVNYILNSAFATYIQRNQDIRNQQIVETLSSLYETYGDWQRVRAQLPPMGMMMGTAVRVVDNNGRLVVDLSPGMGMMGRRGTMGSEVWNRPGAVREAPIIANGVQVGTAYLTQMGRHGMWTAEDLWFLGRINYSIILAGLLAAVLILPATYFLARNITASIGQVTRAAKRLAEGDLNQRVAVHTRDEIGVLAETFNLMADQLQGQERLRKKLIGDIAHELKTPLTTLRIHLEAFQDGILIPDQKNLQVVHEEVMSLVKLVQDLQELSAADAQALNLVKIQTDFGELVEGVVQKMRPLFEEKDIAVELHLSPSPLLAKIDPDAMTRVLHNLLFNAYKYTASQGKVTVAVAREGDQIVMQVSDTGIGIPPEHLPHIFERFYRVDPSRTKETGGTGIGLAIAKELIDAHQGEIRVASTPGVGSTFTVILPPIS